MMPSCRRALSRTIAVACLAAAAASARNAAASTSAAALAALESTAHRDAAGRLQIDVHFDCALAPPSAALSAAGLAVTSSVRAGTLCVVEGWAPSNTLARLDAVAGVTGITAPSYVPPITPRALRSVQRRLTRSPSQKQTTGTLAIDQNGVAIMRADQFLAQTGSNGAGVTVGVQSSGVYSLSAIQARGELPGSVQVLYPAGNSTPVVGDEGTVLLEQIHAVAPGANLMYCGPSTFVDFTSCLAQLISAGATIVLDDTGFPNDGLMSQDNDESSAISQLLSQSPATLMLSSAGNSNGTYWEGNYTPVSAGTTTLPPLSCPSSAAVPDAYVATFGNGNSQTLSVTAYNTFPLLLAWADPPAHLTSQFDVYWLDAGTNTVLGCFSSASATTNQVMDSVTLPPGDYTLVVASADDSAKGKFLKLWAGGDGLTALSVATPGSLVSPQAMASGVITVGAVDGADGIGDTIESFSSSGPLSVAFPAPAHLQAPTLVAPDGINVDAAGTYFAAYLFPDGNFYGTSAAVPNAAGVAALLRGAFPTLSVAQVTTALENGAAALSSTVPDGGFGYGRVDALGALATVPTPTITALLDQTSTGSASTPAEPLSITGTGALHFTVSSSNTALVPNQVVSAGTPGITVSTGCGTSTLTCTLSVTPVAGQAGTALLTISVVDGANRAAATHLTLTATNPGPPSSTGSSSGGSGSTGTVSAPVSSPHSGGGGLQLWALLGLGALLAWSQQRALRSSALAH